MSLTDELQLALAPIRKGIEAGRLAHAYLVVGNPRGNAGRFVDEMLALLYCVSPGARPCRECAGCRRIAQRSHPDLVWVEPQKKSRTIQKDQVQQIQQHVFQTSLEGGWKSVVLVHAERLHEMAANKLLKTLEEPPERCIFLLLSANPEFLPPTIVSRCQRVMLPADTSEDDEFKSAVMEIVSADLEPGVAGGIARARRILDLLKTLHDQVEAEESSEVETEIRKKMGHGDDPGHGKKGNRLDVDSAVSKEMADAVQARIEGKYRERRSALLRWMLFWYRDVLLCVCNTGQNLLYYRESVERIRHVAAGLTYRQALDNIRFVEEIKDQLEQSLPESMVLERGMIRLTQGARES